MPGTPQIHKSEGLIRSHELFEHLRADMGSAFAALEADRSSQYLRRCVVRAVFSYIEAVVECIKIELRSAIRTEQYSGSLTDRERETLGPLTIVGASPGKFLPLESNVKRTFRLAAKMWGLNGFKLRTDGDDFRDFLRAKSARNRLTHPRTYYDIEVTDDDMHCHTVAAMWGESEFLRLLDARREALLSGLSESDRADIQSMLQQSKAVWGADA